MVVKQDAPAAAKRSREVRGEIRTKLRTIAPGDACHLVEDACAHGVERAVVDRFVSHRL